MKLNASLSKILPFFGIVLILILTAPLFASDRQLTCHNPTVIGDNGQLKVHYTESGKIVLSWKTVYVENNQLGLVDASKYEISIFSAPIHVDGIGVQSENFYVVDPILIEPTPAVNRYIQPDEKNENEKPVSLSPQFHYAVIDLLDLVGRSPQFPGYKGNQGEHYLDALNNDKTFVIYIALRATGTYVDSSTSFEPVLDKETGRQLVTKQGLPMTRPVKEYQFMGAPYGPLLPVEVRVNLGHQNANVPERLELKVLEPVVKNSQYYYQEKTRQPVMINDKPNPEYTVQVGANLGGETVEENLSQFDVVNTAGQIEETYDIAIYEDNNGIVDLAILKEDHSSSLPRYPLYEIQVSKWPGFFYPSNEAYDNQVNSRYFSEDERIFLLSQTSWCQLPQEGFHSYLDSQGDYLRPFTQVELSLKETVQALDTKKGKYQFKRVYYGNYKNDPYGRGKEEKGYYYLRVRAHGQESNDLKSSVLKSLKRLFIPIPYQVDTDVLNDAVSVGNDLFAGEWSVPVAIKVNRSVNQIPPLRLNKVQSAQPDVVRIPLKWQYTKAPQVPQTQSTRISSTSPENPNLSGFIYEIVSAKKDVDYESEEGTVPYSDSRSSLQFVLKEEEYSHVSRDYIDQTNLKSLVQSLVKKGETDLYYFMKNFYQGEYGQQQFNYGVDKKLFAQYSISQSATQIFYLNKALFNHFYPDSVAGDYDVVVRPLMHTSNKNQVQSQDFVPVEWSNSVAVNIGTPDGSVPMAFLSARYVGLRVNPTEPRYLPLYWKLGAYNSEGVYEETHPLDTQFVYNQNDETSTDGGDKRVASYLLYVYKSSDAPVLSEGRLPFIDEDLDQLNDYTEVASYDENNVSEGHTGKAVGVFYFTTADIDDYQSSQKELLTDHHFRVPLHISYVPLKNKDGSYQKDDEGNIKTVQKVNNTLEEGEVLKAFLLPIAKDGVEGVIARGVKYTYRSDNFLNMPICWSLDKMRYTDQNTEGESELSIYRDSNIKIDESNSKWGPYTAFDKVKKGENTSHLSIFTMPDIIEELKGDYQFTALDSAGVEVPMTTTYVEQLFQNGIVPLVWNINDINYQDKATAIKSDKNQANQKVGMKNWTKDIWLTKEEQGKPSVDIQGYQVYVYYAPIGSTPTDPRLNPESGLSEMNYVDDNNNLLNDYTEVLMNSDEMSSVPNHAYAFNYIDKEKMGQGSLSDPYAWIDLNIRKWVKRYPKDVASDEYVPLRSTLRDGNYFIFIRGVRSDGAVTDLSNPLQVVINRENDYELKIPRLYDPESEIEEVIQQKKIQNKGETNEAWVDISLKDKKERLKLFKEKGYLPVTWEIESEEMPELYEILVSTLPLQGSQSKAIKEYLDDQGNNQNTTYMMDRSETASDKDYAGYYSLETFMMDDEFYAIEDNKQIKPFFLKDLKQERYFNKTDKLFSIKDVTPIEDTTYYVRARALKQLPIVTNGHVEKMTLLSQWSNQVDVEVGQFGLRNLTLSADDVKYISKDVMEIPLHWSPIVSTGIYLVETAKYYQFNLGTSEMSHGFFNSVKSSKVHKDYVLGVKYIQNDYVWNKNLFDSKRDFDINLNNSDERFMTRVKVDVDKLVALYIQNEDSLWSNIVVSQANVVPTPPNVVTPPTDGEEPPVVEPPVDENPAVDINLHALTPSPDKNGVLVLKWDWSDTQSSLLTPESVERYQIQIYPVQGEKSESEEQLIERTFGRTFSKITRDDNDVYKYITEVQLGQGKYAVRIRAIQYQKGGSMLTSSWSNEQMIKVKGMMKEPLLAVYRQTAGKNDYVLRLENADDIIAANQGSGVIRVVSFSYNPNCETLPIDLSSYVVQGVYTVEELTGELSEEVSITQGRYYVAQLWGEASALNQDGTLKSGLERGEDLLPVDSQGRELAVSLWSCPAVYSGGKVALLSSIESTETSTESSNSNWQGSN